MGATAVRPGAGSRVTNAAGRRWENEAAGYGLGMDMAGRRIGSHVLRALVAAGWEAVVLDNLSTGHAAAVARATGGRAELVVGNVGDCELVRDVLISRKIDAVVHCAAASLVGESMANPSKYWRNNVQEAIGLLDAMVLAGVDKIVFSSSAAVYGEPVAVPIEETHPKSPTSTYGMTKLAIEHMLQSYSAAHSMRWYFNAAGLTSLRYRRGS